MKTGSNMSKQMKLRTETPSALPSLPSVQIPFASIRVYSRFNTPVPGRGAPPSNSPWSHRRRRKAEIEKAEILTTNERQLTRMKTELLAAKNRKNRKNEINFAPSASL